MPNDDERERQVIRDAMDRLLKGQPIRSDGKLTVKSLAAEAGVKRHVLTHKHTDLQDEFRARVRNQDSTPVAIRALHEKITALERARAEDLKKLRITTAERNSLARVVQVLVLKNEQLEDRLQGGPSNLTPI